MSPVKWGLVSIGKRLRECRVALDLKQAELAALCGFTREQQGRFERDANLPGAEYLLKAAAQGIDIGYVLTGEPSKLRPDEQALLDNYRGVCADQQKQLLDTSRVLASVASLKPKAGAR